MIVGQTIAVGIFLTPAGMAKSLASPFWILVCWLVIGFMTACGALCYGALAAKYPETGGGYVFLRRAYGDRVAFLYGWMCMVVMDPGLCAVLAIGITTYLSFITPLTPLAAKAIACALVIALGALNILGARLSAFVMDAFTWAKIAVLVGIPMWALANGAGSWNNFTPFVAQRANGNPLLPALAGGLVGAFFSFGGWWEVSRIAGEIKQPERNLPRALLIGVLIVLGLYLAVSAIFLYVVPLGSIHSDQGFVSAMGERLFGGVGGKVLAGVVVLCVLNSLMAFMLAVPRLYYAMAQDGLFLRQVAMVSSRFGTPYRAIMLQVALACAMILIGTFDQIISYFIFVSVAFLGITCAAALSPKLGLKSGRLPAICFSVMVAALLVLLVAGRPLQSLLGTAMTCSGLVFYNLTKSRGRIIGPSS